MSIDVYFREDVAKVLDAVDFASGGLAALMNEEIEKAGREDRLFDDEALADHLRIYRRGYKNALVAVALAFGVVPHTWAISQENVLSPRIEEFRLPI